MTWNNPHRMTQNMEEIVYGRRRGKEHGIDYKCHGEHHHNGLLGDGNIVLTKEGELFADKLELLS
jgi:hypothetical protein